MSCVLKALGLLALSFVCLPSWANVQLTQRSLGVLELLWETGQPEIYNSKKVQIKGAPNFNKIYFSGMSLSQTPHHPSLPYKSFIVEGAANEMSFSIKDKKVVILNEVTPVPAAKWPCRCEDEKPEWEFREDLYVNSSQKPWLQVTSLGDYKGTPLSRITFYPAKMKNLNTVEFLKSASIEIRGATSWDSTKMLKNLKEQGRFLIISPEKFKADLQVFADAKVQAGFDVVWIDYTNQSSERLAQQIKNLHARLPIDFAVIAGSHAEVPGHLVYTSADPQTPTDRLYFSLGGQGDRVPDVFYSRLVASDSAKMRQLVQKVLKDVKLTPLQHEAIGLASDEGLNPSDEQYIHEMIEPLERQLAWNSQYFLQRRRGDGVDSIIDSFSWGLRWLNYIGHGVGPAWTSVAGGEFNTEHVRQIRAHDVMPVIIDVACQNGRLSHDNRLGVHLMNHHDRGEMAGAKAYYGGNVDISWHPPAVMAVGIGKARAQADFKYLGQVLLAGQLYLLETYEDLPAAFENLSWYHLQGDPSLVMPH